MKVGSPPGRQVRAKHDDETLVVYQAYPPRIAEPAVAAGTFVPPFKRERMTWIKPSFLWMMYRCGWATKPGQERVLAVKITRAGFEWALAHACLADFDARALPRPRGLAGAQAHEPGARPVGPGALDRARARSTHRAIQVGLGGESVDRYVDEWIQGIEDVTSLAHEIHRLVQAGEREAATALLPPERPLELSADAAAAVGAD